MNLAIKSIIGFVSFIVPWILISNMIGGSMMHIVAGGLLFMVCFGTMVFVTDVVHPMIKDKLKK
jgi:hypothetical protein